VNPTHDRRGSVAIGGLLALASIVVTLVALELGVRLVAPQDVDLYDADKLLRNDTEAGFRLYRARAASHFSGVDVRINSLGFRDREVLLPKPAEVFRILAVGDSVTFGFGVELAETYAKRLERRLSTLAGGGRRVEVVNAGLGDTGLDYSLFVLQTRARRLEADLVLVGIVLNDIYDYEEAAQGRAAAGRVSRRLRDLNYGLLRRSHLYLVNYLALRSALYRRGLLDINAIRGHSFLALADSSERQARAWRSSLALLERLVQAGKDARIPLVFVVFPLGLQLDEQALQTYRDALGIRVGASALAGIPQRRLADFAAAHGTPLVDLLPAFRASRGEWLFLRGRSISHDWVHPSPAGHRVAAEEIARALARLGVLRQG